MRISDWSSDVCSSDLWPKPMLSRSKLAVIHVAQARTGLDDDSYRALLKHAAGVGSSKELDDAGFTAVMEVFRQDRKRVVSGQSVSVRVDLGGRRILTKKNPTNIITLPQAQQHK